jgi:hypothetical protein
MPRLSRDEVRPPRYGQLLAVEQWRRATRESRLRSEARRHEPKSSGLPALLFGVLLAVVGAWLLLAYLGVGVGL